MDFKKFVDTVDAIFTRNRMLDDIGSIREELRDNVMPPLKAIVKSFGKLSWKSKWVQDYEAMFDKNVRFTHKGNFLMGILEVLEQAEENIEVMESMARRYFQDDILREALTVVRVNVLQYLEAMDFIVQYSARIAVAAIDMEIVELNNGQKELDITPAELEYLTQKQMTFFAALSSVSIDKKDLEQTFEKMPDININSTNVDVAVATVGRTEIDPLRFNLIPVFLNPIYHVRMKIAQWQATRYKAAVERRTMLEFKLLQLELQKDGKADAALDKRIAHCKKRLDEVNYNIKEMEEDYGTA